jgi:preprotein translocase subunit SecB
MEQPLNPTTTLPDLIAGLQLDRYLVDDLAFKCNTAIVQKDDKFSPPTIGIDFDVKENINDPNVFLIEMVVDLNYGQGPKEFETYQIHLHLYGWFRFTIEMDQAAKGKMMAVNASSMLYGIARTIVANLTGSLGEGRYILPTLNLLAVIKAKMASNPEITNPTPPVIGKP